MINYDKLKKCIAVGRDRYVKTNQTKPAFSYIRQIPTKNREKVRIKHYYPKKVEIEVTEKDGTNVVVKKITEEKFLHREQEMKKIYFESMEEILEGVNQYKEVAKLLSMDDEARWKKFPMIVDVLGKPAYKEVLEN